MTATAAQIRRNSLNRLSLCVGGPKAKLGFFDDDDVTVVSRLSGVTFGVGMASSFSFFGVVEAFLGVDPVDPRTRREGWMKGETKSVVSRGRFFKG